MTTTRARSREERSAHIERVALELFSSRGFDRVTVEDICARAGVGPATFYRHFGTKEGVVFSYRESFATALRTALDAAGALPEPARLSAVVAGFAEFLESQSDLLAVRDEIVLGNPRLLERTLAVQRDLEAVLAEGLARSRGLAEPDADARLAAGLGVLVLRMAVRTWRTSPGTSLVGAVREAFAGVATLVRGEVSPGTPAGVPPGGPPVEASRHDRHPGTTTSRPAVAAPARGR